MYQYADVQTFSPEVELHATQQGKKVAYSITTPAEMVSK